MTVKAGSAAQFLADLGFTKADLEKMGDMVADANVLKAVPRSENDSMPLVEDRWNKGEMHKVPSGETIKVGPGQSASGGGAEHMVREYSNPSPQKGVTLEAEHLERELGPMRGYAKAIGDAHNGLCKSFDVSTMAIMKGLDTLTEQNRRLTLVVASLLKKAEEDEEGDHDEEKEEKIEINAAKARATYAKARSLMKKSRAIKAEMKAATDTGHIGALKAQAKLYRKAAEAYLGKAAEYAAAGKSRAVVTRKALDAFYAANPTLKAGGDPAADHKGLLKAAKKARGDWKVALKAAGTIKKDDDAGNQADEEKKEDGNQADHAAKAAVKGIETRLADALSGFAMLQTDVKGLIDTIGGRSVTPPVAPLSISKAADPDAQIRQFADKIEQLASEKRLDFSMEHRARDVLGKMDARNKGQMTEVQFNAYFETSPQIVKDVFRLAA